MPKTKEQFEQIRNDRINSILFVATDLFATKGFDGVNLDEVTKKAKCSHGLLYHYYKGKEELYQAVLEKIIYPDMEQFFKNINQNQKAKYVVQDLVDQILKLLKSNNEQKIKELYLFSNIHLKKNLKFIYKNEEGHTVIFSTIQKLIDRGKEEGDFNSYPTVELAISLLSLIKGIAFNRLNIGYKRFVCPRSEIVMKMLLK